MRFDKYMQAGMTFGEAAEARRKDREAAKAKKVAEKNTPVAQAILEKLADMFAETDDRVLKNSIEWALGRKKAIAEFKSSKEYEELRRDQWKLYARLHDIAGGKTWYSIFSGNETQIKDFMVKNCAATVEKRDMNIVKKMVKAGVTDITETKYVATDDGFNGFFRFATDKGEKWCKIQTIYAGGYNIQCLHLRVLVDVK